MNSFTVINQRDKPPTHSLSHFMSFGSPSSSYLKGHDASPAGKYSGADSPLQFCDTFFTAHPIQDFPNHACTANQVPKNRWIYLSTSSFNLLSDA